MAQEFIKELERLKAKQAEQGGLNAPAPVAPGFQPQAPQELSSPEFGPTLANEAQLPVEQRTQDGTMIGVPDFNEPYIVPEAAQAFGDVPVNMPSNPLDSNAQISATQDRLPSTPNEIIQKDVQETDRGLGKFRGDNKFKQPDWFQKPIDIVKEEFKKGFEEFKPSLIEETIAPATNPMGVTPEVMSTPEFIAGLSVNGTDVVTPEAITEAAPAAAPAAIQAPELPQQPLPPVMDGSQIPKAGEEGFKFAERGSPQDYFLSQTNDGTTSLSPEQITRGQEYAKQQGLNFDPTTGFSQNTEAPQAQAPQAQAPQAQATGAQATGAQALLAQAPQVQAPQGLTTAGGQPLAEFLAGGQQLDEQGRTINPNVDRSSFEAESAAREARQAARPDFGVAQTRAVGTVTDRERRAERGEGISDADRLAMAKANRSGASARDVARGEKVAALNGIDRKTGKAIESKSTVAEDRLAFDKEKYIDIQAKEAKGVPLTPSEQLQKERFEYLKTRNEKTDAEETTPEQIEKDRLAQEATELDNERKRQIIAKGNEPDATSMQKKRADWEEMKEDMESDNMPEDEIAARRKAFLYGDKFDAFNYGGGTSNKGKAADEVEMTDAKGIRRLVPAKDKEEAIKNGYTLV